FIQILFSGWVGPQHTVFTASAVRPSSARSKRNTEKRRTLECKKVYDKILAQYKDPEYCLLKYRQIIGNRLH
ncbi:unnamed protein product, partial [Nesidiocoris tenuis]